jgi:hypothetical protein
MRTVRRLYFYLLSLISTQVVIWAVVNLLRTIFRVDVVSGAVDWIAGGIAFVVVGAPIFWLHWSTVQREAGRDKEEASSRIRALYLYATLLATGIPITYTLLAIFNRLITQVLGLSSYSALLGGAQTHTDNLIALAANLIVLIYFYRILKHDWQTVEDSENLIEISRLHRFVWMIYGLGLTTFGTQQILRYIFFQPQDFGQAAESGLATGLALIPIGLPIWTQAWRYIQKSLTSAKERTSSLRLVVLYVLTFLGIGFTLTTFGILLANGFRWLFQVESWTVRTFLDVHASQLSAFATLVVIWAYFGRERKRAIADQGEITRQASLHRIYNNILSFAGLIVSFVGLLLLFGFIIESFFNLSIGNNAAMLSDSLALLIIGLPLWLRFWQKIQQETTLDDSIGLSARKSVMRKGYLYLALFATVVGTMLSTGWWIYGILFAVLDHMPVNFWLNFFLQLRLAILFALFLVYHLKVLRTDNRESRAEKTEEFQKYPVLVLQSGDSSFGEAVIKAIQEKSPHLTVNLHQLEQESANDELPEVSLFVIPSSLTLNPTEPLRTHLQNFNGKVLVIPENLDNWHWLSTSNKDQHHQMKEIAEAIHQLSENQPIRPSSSSSPWVIAAYILAGLFILEIIFVAVASLVSILMN